MNTNKKIWIKNILMLFFILNVIHIQAIEIEIDLRNLEENSSIFVEGGHEVKKIPESGILKIQVENLPNLIQIVSLVKRKLVPLKTIWITKNNLKINGSISKSTIVLAASEMGEILPDDIENKWNKIDINKHPASVSSMPFLVYLANNLQSQKTDNLKRIVKNFSKTELDFWAGGKIKTYLEDLESIGFDPLKNQFEHLTAINKKGGQEKYKRIQGKFLLIDFSSSGCKPCLEDIDKLVRLKNDFSNNLEILSIWDDAKQELWLKIAKEQKDKIIWKSLRDESLAIFQKFEINVYPTYLLINPAGQVVKKWKGSGIEKARKYLKRNKGK